MEYCFDYDNIRRCLYSAIEKKVPNKLFGDKIKLKNENLYELQNYKMNAAELEQKFDIGEKFIDSNGIALVAYKKVQFLEKYERDGDRAYGYHLCWCKYLNDSVRERNFKRDFIVTTEATGYFDVVYKDVYKYKDKPVQERRKMKICDKCFYQLKLDSKGYDINNFALTRFCGEAAMEKSAETMSKFEAEYSYVSNTADDYPVAWERIARQLKQIKNYTCEECGARYAERDGNIQIHHIDNDRSNCTWNNLKVLCKSCHDKYHPTRPGAGK